MRPDSFALGGRTAVVSGAVGLLGREHCAALGEAGANVVVTDVNEQACRAFAEELAAREIPALAVAADITDKSAIVRLRDAVLARFGSLDVVVNNAAVDDKFDPGADLEASRFESYSLDRFRRSMDVNVTGTFLMCQVLGAEMVRSGKGSIINVASTYGLGAPDQALYEGPDGQQRFFKSAAYPTSKAAVLGLTRYLAAYWGKTGVRVNSLSPGGVEAGQDPHFVAAYSKRTPLGRMARRDEYRGAIIYLASDASSYANGTNLVVDGGWTAW